LRPDPLRPLFHRLRNAVPANLARAYIECTADRAISIERQRAMAMAASIGTVISMETDHSPFLSAPHELAAHLSALATSLE
jgi:hypothetical protein